jgi:hypothetical protein
MGEQEVMFFLVLEKYFSFLMQDTLIPNLNMNRSYRTGTGVLR